MSLREQLQAIYEEHRRLTPALVVDVAREPGHPLHARLEWDDSVAGEAYRRQQAQELITSVQIVYRTSEGGKEHKVRAFHAVRSETDGTNGGYAYHPADQVVRDPLLTRLLMQDMEREWRQLKARYDQFVEFWELVKADAEAA